MGRRDMGRWRQGENKRRSYGEERYREEEVGREYEEELWRGEV